MKTALIIYRLVNAYFMVNMFIAGFYYCELKRDIRTIRDYFWLVIVLLIAALFALPIYILHDILYLSIKRVCIAIDNRFQISFLFAFYFTKEFDKLEKYKLERIGRICENHFNKNTIHDRIYRHCARMIFKRNNFTYTHEEQEF